MTTKLSPVHPGEVLREDFLAPSNISANRLAMDIRVSASRIGEIIKGRRSVTTEMALRLARYFGTTAQFWMSLQSHYDLQVAEDESASTNSRGCSQLEKHGNDESPK